MNGETLLVEELLSHDASIYSIDSQNDDAIYYAVLTCNKDMIKLIQTKKVDYDKKYGGYTVLELSQFLECEEAIIQIKEGLK
jgi:hypothetical protein